MRRDGWGSGRSVAAWMGLICVYSAIPWLIALLRSLEQGFSVGVLVLLLRMLATLALGIALCATERWAWATGLCASVLYLVLGLTVSAVCAWTVAAARPSLMFWQPVLYDLTRDQCLRVAAAGLATALLSAPIAALLWRARGEFGIPERRAWSHLLRLGAAPALAFVAADSYLVYGLWRLQSQ